MSSFGNQSQGGGGRSEFVRLSGLFPTKKGGLIGRIEQTAFNTVYRMMQEANAIGGTLNLVISKNKQSGKPEVYAVVGQPYENKQAAAAPAGPFGPSPAPVATPQPTAPAASGPFAQAAPSREVAFGQVDVPKDDFDSLLESLK